MKKTRTSDLDQTQPPVPPVRLGPDGQDTMDEDTGDLVLALSAIAALLTIGIAIGWFARVIWLG
jgi:hypothetical protein